MGAYAKSVTLRGNWDFETKVPRINRFQGVRSTSRSRSCRPKGRIPNRFKFRPGLPFGHVGIVGDAISNQKVKLGIFDRPAQVPVRLNFVGGLVIPFGGK